MRPKLQNRTYFCLLFPVEISAETREIWNFVEHFRSNHLPSLRAFHIHNTHFGGSRVLREQNNFLKWQSFLTNLKNTFIFGKNQHIIIWIMHPTRSFGALSKRDCSYLIRFCPYRRERKIFFFLVALRRRLSESTFVILCVWLWWWWGQTISRVDIAICWD